MPKITSRSSLNQGQETISPATVIIAAPITTDSDARIHTSASNDLPALAANEYFEIREHSLSQNNGLWQVVNVTTTTDDYDCLKISGASPSFAGAESVTTLGATGASTEKSVFFDTALLEVWLIEQGNLDSTGVIGQAIYSFMMEEWKDDDFLISNASFPVLAIDTDAGKFIIGQNAAGEDTGWNWRDDSTVLPAIRSRKLLRAMGWDEVNSSAVTINRYVNATTLGTFEDSANDLAFYQFGTDTTVDDTVDFDFAGPVDEAVRFFERLADGTINGGTGVAISADGRQLTRSDGSTWRTDGFLVGGKIQTRDCENAINDTLSPQTGQTAGFLISQVESSTDGDILTVGTAVSPTATEGYDFVDGGGGNDQIDRTNAGGSWLDEGYFVGGNITVANAETGGNNGDYTILVITDTLIDVATASLTADTDDNSVVFGPFLDTGSPDTLMNAAVNNDNAIRLGLRVRDGDTNGKTFGEANLATVGKTALGNFIFAFPLANATDLKISATDADITGNTPYTGMSITFHSTPQARAGLVGGSFNFGIIMDGNDGTNVECFEFIQWSLRQLTDIDADADTNIGRTIGLLARFNGDDLEVGSGDGGLTFPTNPDGGGPGMFIDSLNSASSNDITMYDSLNTQRVFPETIAVTLDFNQVAIDDALTEFDLFYAYTIRVSSATLLDLVITAGSPATFTSAGADLNNNATLDAGDYVVVSGLTGGDAAMNGSYQIITETTPGSAWDVVRQDGVTIVSVAATAANIDQHAVDTPGAILVHTNVNVAGTTISFAAPDQCLDSGNGFGVFAVGEKVEIEGTTSALNDGIFEIATQAVGQLDFVEQTITTQGTGPTVDVTEVVSALALADFTFNYDFDGNVQGGRTVSTPVNFVGKAVGFSSSQYISSPVSQLVSGTPLTIPLFAQTERNTA